ncbi:MAG TPA: efflux RND transporter periplasmic adaptor subunit [Labilithrix sp.]|nr:efflux RND transporter periplasmic adaptor subunit [Labilithrix sp.]
MTDQLSSDLASLRINRDAPTPPSPIRRAIVPVIVLCAIGGAGWLGWQKLEGQILKQEVKTTEVALISPSQAEVTVTATGYVIPQRTSKVGSKLPGRLAKVMVSEGDTVKEGQVLAQLEDEDQRSQIVAASSKVGVASARTATARANLAEVTQQVERERALVASGTVGKANLDNLVARESALRQAVKAAEAEASSAQADVGTFGVGLKDRVIIAPIGGRIVTKPATVGEFVGGIGNVGLIAEIVDFDSLLVETDVPETRLHMIKIGGPAEIVLDAYPNRRYRGVAAELGLRVNRAKATVVVKVKFTDPAENVLPEMSARVSFLSKPITDAALKEAPKRVVAADAVVDRGDQKVVFAIESGKLHIFPVKVGGPVGGSAVELLDGPAPGVKVVAKPTAETADGQRIKETDK